MRIGILVRDRSLPQYPGIVVPAQFPELADAISVVLPPRAGNSGATVTSRASDWEAIEPEGEGVRVVILVDMEGTPNACLPHTYTDRIESLKIDGDEVGEIGMLTRLIASHGTPVVMVTGDFAATQEAKAQGISITASSKSVGTDGTVKHRDHRVSRTNITVSAYQSVRHLIAGQPGLIPAYHPGPGQFEVRVRRGYEVSPDAEAELVGESTYRIEGADIRESYAAFQRFVNRLPSAGVAPMSRTPN